MESENSCGCTCSEKTRTARTGTDQTRADQTRSSELRARFIPNWVIGAIDTPAGSVPVVSTRLSAADLAGGWKARWKVGRMTYRLDPGLYAAGKPGVDDPVLVTANYKLTFDRLRQELGGRNAWILVLDTRGINVWCAAGKGVLSTEEVVSRVLKTGLDRLVAHRTLILPQLAGPGVSAHRVRQESGFQVVYGPVRAKDLPAFLDSGRKATPEMRTVTFSLTDRLVVIPVEFVSVMKHFLVFLAVAAAFNYTLGDGTAKGLAQLALPVLGALLLGTVVVPLLLPVLPFRSFTLKGWVPGLLWAVGANLVVGAGFLQSAGNLLLLPVLSAAYALAFTGTTTFTSQAGVNREIRLFGRPMAILGTMGTVFMVANFFV